MSKEAIDDYARRQADKMIAKLEAGTLPWVKPWDNTMPDGCRPFCPATGRHYTGSNFLVLGMQDYEDPRWLTLKQANDLGCQIKKGQKGTVVQRGVYDKDVWNEEKKVKEKVKLDRPFFLPYFVFNAEQISGLPAYQKPEVTWEPCTRADDLMKSYGVPIEHRAGDRAFYSPAADKIVMPLQQQFKSLELYYGVLCHEGIHSSGHSSRLGRDLSGSFGSKSYALEELRAEMGSWMLCSELGLASPGVDENHAAYIQSWIQALKDDPKVLFKAAADAEKAMRLLLTHDHVLFKDAQVEARKITPPEKVQQREPQRSRQRQRSNEPMEAGASR